MKEWSFLKKKIKSCFWEKQILVKKYLIKVLLSHFLVDIWEINVKNWENIFKMYAIYILFWKDKHVKGKNKNWILLRDYALLHDCTKLYISFC